METKMTNDNDNDSLSLDMALDDIISKQKMPPRRIGKRPPPNPDGPLTPSTFGRNNRLAGPSRRNFSGAGSRFGAGKIKNDEVIWINIANLPDTVLTTDLQELFQDFNMFGVGVHYDEFGQHMGTADLFVDAASARAILHEYSNVAIDGAKIRFAIVSEQASRTPQFQNRVAPHIHPARDRFNRGASGTRKNLRSNSARSSRTYSRSRSRSPINRSIGSNVRENIRKASKTTEELDRELEAYMKGNKHPRIKSNDKE